VIIVSLAGTAAGSLLTGFAGSLFVLFLGRIIDGASGASVSVAQASVTDLAEPEQRPRLLGLLAAAFGVGFVFGPALGALAALGGPKVPFLVAGVLAGVNAIVAIRRLPETRPRHRAEVERAAAATQPDDPTTVLARRRGLTRFAVAAFVGITAFSAFEATFALFGQERFGWTEASVAAVFVGIGLFLVPVQAGLVHPVVARFGALHTLEGGLALTAAGLAVIAVAKSWPVLVVALALLVLGQGLASPTLSTLVANRARADRRGAALGIQQSVAGVARIVGPIAGGLLFQHVSVPAPYIAGAVLNLIALAVVSAAGPTA
jgi:predicted MFS family arabinose efflux permease